MDSQSRIRYVDVILMSSKKTIIQSLTRQDDVAVDIRNERGKWSI